jgi:hypothetical protein
VLLVQLSSNYLDAEGSGEKHSGVCGQESLGLVVPAALRDIVCFFCRGKRITLPVETDLAGKPRKLSVHNHKQAPNCNVYIHCCSNFCIIYCYRRHLTSLEYNCTWSFSRRLWMQTSVALYFQRVFCIYFTYVYILCCSTYLALVHILLVLTFDNSVVLLVLSLNNEFEIMWKDMIIV